MKDIFENDDEKDIVDMERELLRDEYKKKIGNRLTQLRLGEEKPLSEVQLSEIIGKERSYIQGVASGRSFPSIAALIDICDYFGITLAEFFSETILSPTRLKLKERLNDLSEDDIELIIKIIERWK